MGLTPISYDDDHHTDDHYNDYHHTDDHYDDDHATDDHHRRWLAGAAVNDNTGSDGELFFMISGWILFGLAVANFFISRWSEIRLLRKAGCNSTEDYHTRLLEIEKDTMEARVSAERDARW